MTLPRSLLVLAGLSALSSACGGEETSSPPEKPPVEVEEVPEELPALPDLVGARLFEDLNPDPHVLEVNLSAHYADVELEPGVMTSVMAYNGGTPGPTLYARVGDKVIVHFDNQLMEPTTVHWHGLRISDDMDGNPRIQNPVEPGGTFTYEFELPEAGTYWYHPHMNTVQQVERGLYGSIVVVEDDAPVFTKERLMVLDDIRLNAAGQLSFFQKSGMDVMHGRFGDTFLQNGRTEPLEDTVPYASIERWRIVNTATARHMVLTLEGASWRVIGTDGGLIPEPYTTNRLEITVGQRFDVEVRFDQPEGTAVRLDSQVLALDENDNVVEVPVPVAEFQVKGETTSEEPRYPAVKFPEVVAGEEQEIVLSGYNSGGEIKFTINGKSGEDIPELHFDQGVPRVLRIRNEIGPYHPFHLHGQFFQILERNGKPANEPGLKDTVLVDGFDEVTVFTKFENPGMWMYHCHIPEHAEGGMMGHLMVMPAE